MTHDQEEALILGDQVAVMAAGRIVQTGTAREVYDRPATRFVAGFIGDFNIIEPDAVAALFGTRTTHAWAIHPEAIDVAGSGQPGHLAPRPPSSTPASTAPSCATWCRPAASS